MEKGPGGFHLGTLMRAAAAVPPRPVLRRGGNRSTSVGGSKPVYKHNDWFCCPRRGGCGEDSLFAKNWTCRRCGARESVTGKSFRLMHGVLVDPRTAQPVREDEEPTVTPSTHPLKQGGMVGFGVKTIKYRFDYGVDFVPMGIAMQWADALLTVPPGSNLR